MFADTIWPQAKADLTISVMPSFCGPRGQPLEGDCRQIRQICAHVSADVAYKESAQIDASLCQVVRAVFFLACELALFCWSAGCRRVVTGPGVAWPKSWRSGCELAALAT